MTVPHLDAITPTLLLIVTCVYRSLVIKFFGLTTHPLTVPAISDHEASGLQISEAPSPVHDL